MANLIMTINVSLICCPEPAWILNIGCIVNASNIDKYQFHNRRYGGKNSVTGHFTIQTNMTEVSL